MAKQLLGKEVIEALVAALQGRTRALKEKGVTPTLGIIRLGENPSDLSYEKGATKRAEEVGVAIKNYILPGRDLQPLGSQEGRGLHDPYE